ncbi:hypothetical protein [Nocardia mexicana]|nr:hypothetical protein [Nocardia mexicana]
MSAEIAALAQRVATARGKLPLQTDPALFDEMSDSEIAAERDLAEWIRAQRRRQRRGAVTAELAAEKRDRRVERALRRADDADARWHRKALAARRRVSNPDARLAQLYRRAEWSSRALIGVVVLGMVWAGVNVQQNLVPSGDMSDPLYWLSYGFEAMISIPIITIMVVATTAARWGREIARGKVVFLEAALLGVTIALNAGPHLAGGAPARAAEAAVAPVMVGVVIWLHAWVSARYAQLIDAIPDNSAEHGRTVTHRIVDAFAPVREGSGSRRLSAAHEYPSGPMLSNHSADDRAAAYRPGDPGLTAHSVPHPGPEDHPADGSAPQSPGSDHIPPTNAHGSPPDTPRPQPSSRNGRSHPSAEAVGTSVDAQAQPDNRHGRDHRSEETAAPRPTTDRTHFGDRNGHAYPPDDLPANGHGTETASTTLGHKVNGHATAEPYGNGRPIDPLASYPQSTRDDHESNTRPTDIAPGNNGHLHRSAPDRHPRVAPSHNGDTHPSPTAPTTSGFGNHTHDLPANTVEHNGFPTPSRGPDSNQVNPQHGASPTTGHSGRNGHTHPAAPSVPNGFREPRLPQTDRRHSAPNSPSNGNGNGNGNGQPAPRINGEHSNGVAEQSFSERRYQLGESADTDAERVSPSPDEGSPSGGQESDHGDGPRPAAAPTSEPTVPTTEQSIEPGDDRRPASGSPLERTGSTGEPDTGRPGPNGSSRAEYDGETGTIRQHTGSVPNGSESQGRNDSRRTAKKSTAAHPYTRRPASAPETAEPQAPTEADRQPRAQQPGRRGTQLTLEEPAPDVSKYRRPYAVVETEPEAAEQDSTETRASADDLAAEIDNVGVWAVAREISERRLSKLPVEQLAEILTLADESWTPAAIGSSIGLPGSRILGILEAARRIRLPYAVSG